MSITSLVQTITAKCISLFYSSLVILFLIVHPIQTFNVIVKKKPKRDVMPAVLNNPRLGCHGYVRLKDVRIHYVANGREGQPLMLLLHGFPEFWYSWRFQLQEFASDYRVVAIDMRGYGLSDKPDGIHNYRIERLVEDVRQTIQALGYSDCVLVGHDWGGIVAYNFAKYYPDMTKKLVMMNAPHVSAFVKRITSSWSQFKKSWYTYFFQMPYLPEFVFSMGDCVSLNMIFKGEGGVKNSNVTKKDVEAYKHSFSGPGGFTGPINYYRALLMQSAIQRERRKVVAPTLMIWGTKDSFLDVEIAEKSKPYFADYTIRFIDGGSHWIPMDRPTEVNKYMRDFLL